MQNDEVTAAIREIRVKVEARRGSLAVPDLMPLVHARDRAEAKAASIGTVNPRPRGVANGLLQWVKRGIARGLHWHVREQVEFNRGVMEALQATLEALTETNRALAEARATAERTQTDREIHILRTIAELRAAFDQRSTETEERFREVAAQQHREFSSTTEKLIHGELRLIRQRSALGFARDEVGNNAPPVPALHAIDWLRFAEHFRGSEERVKEHQRRYVSQFLQSDCVLDLGCGRGEFLEVAREAGIAAKGIDQSAECVALCQSKGLEAERADVFSYLNELPDASLSGVLCSHVIEHLEPKLLPELLNLLAKKMQPQAVVAMETPDAEASADDGAGWAAGFYLDPTHTRPVPAALLRFYLIEAGFGAIETERLGGAYAMAARKL